MSDYEDEQKICTDDVSFSFFLCVFSALLLFDGSIPVLHSARNGGTLGLIQ